MKKALLLFVLALASTAALCTPVVVPPPPPPPPPPSLTLAEDVRMQCGTGDIAGISVTMTPSDPTTVPAQTIVTNSAGYAHFIVAPIQRAGFTWAAGGGCRAGSSGDQVIGLKSHPVGGNPDAFRFVMAPNVTIRTGVVRWVGRVPVDDQGPFHPTCVTLFWAPWGEMNARGKYEANLADLDNKTDCIRILTEVGGASWSDRVIDPASPNALANLGAAIDHAYDHGKRISMTIVGGGTGHEQQACDNAIAVIPGREQKMLAAEIANEGNWSDTVARNTCYHRLKAAFPWLRVSSYSEGDAVITAEIIAAGNADYATPHTDREDLGGSDAGHWRQARQIYDFRDLTVPCDDNEPPGPESSVATMEKPIHLAMTAFMSRLMGCAVYTFHTGPGIRGGGQADLDRGRHANFRDLPGFFEDLAAIHAATVLLPSDVENWAKAGSHWSSNPLIATFQDDAGRNGQGVIAQYAAFRGNEFLEAVLGIVGQATWTARYAMTVDVYDPVVCSTQSTTCVPLQTFTLASGGSFTLAAGNGGYILHGR